MKNALFPAEIVNPVHFDPRARTRKTSAAGRAGRRARRLKGLTAVEILRVRTLEFWLSGEAKLTSKNGITHTGTVLGA